MLQLTTVFLYIFSYFPAGGLCSEYSCNKLKMDTYSSDYFRTFSTETTQGFLWHEQKKYAQVQSYDTWSKCIFIYKVTHCDSYSNITRRQLWGILSLDLRLFLTFNSEITCIIELHGGFVQTDIKYIVRLIATFIILCSTSYLGAQIKICERGMKMKSAELHLFSTAAEKIKLHLKFNINLGTSIYRRR